MRAWWTAALVVLASCGGGGDHAVLLHAPFIQDLVVSALTPLVEGRPGIYEFLASTGGGSVTSDPAGITCPGSCTATFPGGQHGDPQGDDRGWREDLVSQTLTNLLRGNERGPAPSEGVSTTSRWA